MLLLITIDYYSLNIGPTASYYGQAPLHLLLLHLLISRIPFHRSPVRQIELTLAASFPASLLFAYVRFFPSSVYAPP
jgi:hypothetical protein